MSFLLVECQGRENLFDRRVPRLNQLRDSAQATGQFLAVSNARSVSLISFPRCCILPTAVAGFRARTDETTAQVNKWIKLENTSALSFGE
jgi:hypothetical protein